MTAIAVAGGGTAGHIEPALNTADEFVRQDPATRVVVLGTERGLETKLVPKRGYELTLIPAVPFPRRPNRDAVTLPVRLRKAIRETHQTLLEQQVEVVVGFGGYVSVPAYLGARRAGIPIVVHEANAKPGMANKLGARFTDYVYENYAGSLPHAQRIGCPLRPAIAQLDRPKKRDEARRQLGLAPDRQTLLVFGGSQGAQHINEAVDAALPTLTAENIQVLHARGDGKGSEDSSDRLYHPRPYLHDMDLAYAAADLVICRAGAMTCAEVAAVGLPAIYVPYAVGNGEQRHNAAPVVAAGGGLMVRDGDFTGELLLTTTLPLLGEPTRLAQMGQAASNYGIRDAAQRLVAAAYNAMGGKAVADNAGNAEHADGGKYGE